MIGGMMPVQLDNTPPSRTCSATLIAAHLLPHRPVRYRRRRAWRTRGEMGARRLKAAAVPAAGVGLVRQEQRPVAMQSVTLADASSPPLRHPGGQQLPAQSASSPAVAAAAVQAQVPTPGRQAGWPVPRPWLPPALPHPSAGACTLSARCAPPKVPDTAWWLEAAHLLFLDQRRHRCGYRLLGCHPTERHFDGLRLLLPKSEAAGWVGGALHPKRACKPCWLSKNRLGWRSRRRWATGHGWRTKCRCRWCRMAEAVEPGLRRGCAPGLRCGGAAERRQRRRGCRAAEGEAGLLLAKRAAEAGRLARPGHVRPAYLRCRPIMRSL